MKEIDVRGLSCPEPVLIVMDEMERLLAFVAGIVLGWAMNDLWWLWRR